jgi:hypothetical protein
MKFVFEFSAVRNLYPGLAAEFLATYISCYVLITNSNGYAGNDYFSQR